jgi:microcystin-dependent protein
MASPRLSLPTPDGTDLIAAGDDAISTLADILDRSALWLVPGTFAARPAAAGNDGRFYLANDVGIIYVSDGTTWIEVSRGGGEPPIGSAVDYAGDSDPSDARWLLGDGRAISRTTYAAAFAVMGTRHGAGNGTTTFNIPDYRGRGSVAPDNMGTGAGGAGRMATNNTLAATGGTETTTLAEVNLPAHAHGVGTLATTSAGSHDHGAGTLATASAGAHTHGTGTLTTVSAGSHTHPTFTASVGEHSHQNAAGVGAANFLHGPQQGGNFIFRFTHSAPYPFTDIYGWPETWPAGAHSHGAWTDAAGAHTHGINGATASDGAHTHAVTGTVAANGAHTHPVTGATASVGAGTAFSNMHPYLVMNKIVRVA